jgi:hypothetical protein
MSTPADLIALAQTLATPFLIDLCDVLTVTMVSDGFSGKTLGSPSAVLSDLACMVEELGGAGAQTIIGGETYISSHRIFVKTSPTILGLTPRHQIRVHARGDTPVMIFEQPIVKKETFSPLITIYCTLVQQGFRTPGAI